MLCYVSHSFTNGLSKVRDYDPKGQLIYQSLGSADTRVYTYDANDNLTQKQSLPEVGNYTYDPLNRLIDETTSSGDHNAYTYDGNGNRLTDLKANGKERPYSYTPNTNQLVGLGIQTLTLDQAGNTVSDRNGNRSYTYDNPGQLQTVTVNGVLKGTYTYNHLHQRTRKIRPNADNTGTITLIYHYDRGGKRGREGGKGVGSLSTYENYGSVFGVNHWTYTSCMSRAAVRWGLCKGNGGSMPEDAPPPWSDRDIDG